MYVPSQTFTCSKMCDTCGMTTRAVPTREQSKYCGACLLARTGLVCYLRVWLFRIQHQGRHAHMKCVCKCGSLPCGCDVDHGLPGALPCRSYCLVFPTCRTRHLGYSVSRPRKRPCSQYASAEAAAARRTSTSFCAIPAPLGGTLSTKMLCLLSWRKTSSRSQAE